MNRPQARRPRPGPGFGRRRGHDPSGRARPPGPDAGRAPPTVGPQGVGLDGRPDPPAARTDAEKKSVRAAERDRPDIKTRRAEWPGVVAGVRPEDLVFIDETGANTAMTRTHGYAPRGERVSAAVPHGHWETVTFVAGLTTAGMTAPIAFDEPMTGAVFVAYVEQVLVPTLRPGMVVIPDNLPAHHVSGVREAIEGAGCRVEYPAPV